MTETSHKQRPAWEWLSSASWREVMEKYEAMQRLRASWLPVEKR